MVATEENGNDRSLKKFKKTTKSSSISEAMSPRLKEDLNDSDSKSVART
jgi:hypothetical protein